MPFFDAADRTRLAYEDYGSGSPIVFASSAMLSTDMWEYQIPFFLEQGYRCIAMDWRGHGRSDRPSTGYDFDTLTDDLGSLISHLDLRDITLVGHSMGAAVAARLASQQGEGGRVRRVALISGMVPFLKLTEDNPGIPEAAFDALLAAIRADRLKWLSDQAQVFFATHLGAAVSPYLVNWTINQCAATAPYAVHSLQRAVFHTDHRAALQALTLPTLIVHGAADFSAPVEVTGRRTAEMVRHSQYKEYPDAGHGIFASHHDELNADLLEFIKNA